jgi:hypothetical protein
LTIARSSPDSGRRPRAFPSIPPYRRCSAPRRDASGPASLRLAAHSALAADQRIVMVTENLLLVTGNSLNFLVRDADDGLFLERCP